MSTPDRSLVVTILKIFNWNQPQASNLFEFSFFSLKTSALILSKTIKATITPTEVHFNYSLKVAYQLDQNQILIKLAHSQQHKHALTSIAEFTLNLDHLSHKKNQFFPFGKNDKVLKIAAGEPDRHLGTPSQPHSNNNWQFIRQKEEFLKRMGSFTSSSRFKGETSPVKSFSQQALDLMAQIKSIKNHKAQPHSGVEQQFNDYYHQQPNQYSQQVRVEKPMNKSNSASHLEVGVRGKPRLAPPVTGRVRGDEDSSNRSNRSQKHKLILNNLQLVACKNEYYQQFEVSQLSRKSDMLGTSSLTKKKLFKSQLC